jgi:hypothetical protein
MKIKSTFLVLGAMLLAGISHAQDGWNWPSDPAQEAKAREFNAAYFDYMKAICRGNQAFELAFSECAKLK